MTVSSSVRSYAAPKPMRQVSFHFSGTSLSLSPGRLKCRFWMQDHCVQTAATPRWNRSVTS